MVRIFGQTNDFKAKDVVKVGLGTMGVTFYLKNGDQILLWTKKALEAKEIFEVYEALQNA